MVKVSDCGCCDCDSKQEYETVKERALSSVNKVYTTEGATFYPDGTGMVTLPIPTNAQITQWAQDTETIKTNSADIADLETRVEGVEETTGKIPTAYNLYRDGTGKIRLQASATDGSLIDSNTLDMIIPYQYDLISGTTSRSFRLQITMSDGAQYLTNDFVIPEGGGTDVTVTGIVLSKDTGDVNRIHVQINLSDSTMIDSGYISMVDSVGATYADGKLTISVNGVSSVPVAVDVTGEFSAGEGIKIASGTISISDELAARLTQIDTDIDTLENDVTNVLTIANRAFDAITVSDNTLTLERGNGGTETVELPSGGEDWEELDLSNLPTDFKSTDILKITFDAHATYSSGNSWSTTLNATNISISTNTGAYKEVITAPLGSSIQYYRDIIHISPSLNQSNVAISILYIYSITLAAFWNVGTEPVITLTAVSFNGASSVAKNISITPSNLSTYVKSIKRKI